MDRVAKEKVVLDLTNKFNESNFFILTHNNGLSVEEMTSLRNQLREAGSTFKVVKNSLAKIAISDTKIEELSDYFSGPLAIVFSEELTSQPKIISDFTKDNENLSVVGGYMDGEIIDKETISKLASLPSIDALRSKIIGSLTSSASKIAGIVNKPGEQIVQVLSAKSNSGEAA
tara:strand:- start:885 stop:1403 length:519 start_codon:yes stop_codon:yes gene_type:complete